MDHPNKPKKGPEKGAAARPGHSEEPGSAAEKGANASAAQPHRKAEGRKHGGRKPDTVPESPASQKPAPQLTAPQHTAPQHTAHRKPGERTEPERAERAAHRITHAKASVGRKPGRPQPPKGAQTAAQAAQTHPAAQEPPQNRPAKHPAAQTPAQTPVRNTQQAQKAQTADPKSRSAHDPQMPLRERLRKSRQSILRRIEYRRLKRIRKRTVPAYAHCKNCGETLQGMYCHRCGQYALDIEQPFWKYIRQYFENVYQFDGKVWQTLYLLFRRPGLLTNEFNAGKINSYVHPLRLYMFVSVIFFTLFFMFASSWVGRQMEEIQAQNLPRGIIDSLKAGALRPDTTVWVLKGRQFAELLHEEGVADRDTLVEAIPVYRTTGLALMRLPHVVVDSCFYETPLLKKDSVKIMELKVRYLGNDSDATNPDPVKQRALDKRSSVLAFQPGTTPIYDWRKNPDEMATAQNRTFVNMLMGSMSKWTPFFMLFLLPLFALLIRFAYRRSGMRYMNHFVHAIHINTVFLLLVAAPTSILLFYFEDKDHAAILGSEEVFWYVPACLFALIFIYMAISFRTVYHRNWFKTVLKTLFVFCTFSLTALMLAFGLILGILVYYADKI